VRSVDVDGTQVPHVVSVAWVGSIGAALLPVVNVPAGFTPGGLPVGVQVVGPYLSDRRLLRLAEIMTKLAGPGFVAPPLATD
jgi:amidase